MGLANGPVADCHSPFDRHNVVILSSGQTVPDQGVHHWEIKPAGPGRYRPIELHILTQRTQGLFLRPLYLRMLMGLGCTG